MRLLPLLLTLFATLSQANAQEPQAQQEPLRIAVAANFKPTLELITEVFAKETGTRVAVSSASTGVHATQIERGAPFHLFFAADRNTPLSLQGKGIGARAVAFCYARGTLALAGALELSALADPSRSLAIANPVTAPYGRAATEVLARPEFDTATARKLVRGNNVAQAYQFWHSGAVDLALLPQAIAPADALAIPQHWHAPVDQYALPLREHPMLGAYLTWVRSDTVRDLIYQAGYEPCP